MPKAEITYRDSRTSPLRRWCFRVGTRAEIDRSARELLDSMRESGDKSAVVMVDGKRIRLRGARNA